MESTVKSQIDTMNMDELVQFIGSTQNDIAHLDITRDDYWEAKSNLQQNIIWAWQRVHILNVNQIIDIIK